MIAMFEQSAPTETADLVVIKCGTIRLHVYVKARKAGNQLEVLPCAWLNDIYAQSRVFQAVLLLKKVAG